MRILIALALGLVGMHLLIPQQIVKHHACCLDDRGYLKAAEEPCCTHAKRDQSGLEDPDNCCTPIVCKLRGSTPPLTALKKAPSVNALDGWLGRQPAFRWAGAVPPCEDRHFRAPSHAPPQELLSIYSIRLI